MTVRAVSATVATRLYGEGGPSLRDSSRKRAAIRVLLFNAHLNVLLSGKPAVYQERIAPTASAGTLSVFEIIVPIIAPADPALSMSL